MPLTCITFAKCCAHTIAQTINLTVHYIRFMMGNMIVAVDEIYLKLKLLHNIRNKPRESAATPETRTKPSDRAVNIAPSLILHSLDGSDSEFNNALLYAINWRYRIIL